VIVGRSIEQPGGPPKSVDRYPGSAMISLLGFLIYTIHIHNEEEPVVHIELFVLSLCPCVYNTGTPAYVTKLDGEYAVLEYCSVRRPFVLSLTH
jgi:hypothetical protein